MSTSRPDNLAPRTNTRKKKKSGLSGLLAAICGTDKGHETESPRSTTTPRPAAAGTTETTKPEGIKEQDKVNKAVTPQSSGTVEPRASGSKTIERPEAVTSQTTANEPSASDVEVLPVAPQTMLAVPSLQEKDENVTKGTAGMDIVDPSKGTTRSSAAAVTLGTAYPVPSQPHSILPIPAVNEMAQAGGVGRESPAQELGMTDVEMGAEHDRSEDGVIVPAGAATDGVRVPLEEVSPSNSPLSLIL